MDVSVPRVNPKWMITLNCSKYNKMINKKKTMSIDIKIEGVLT